MSDDRILVAAERIESHGAGFAAAVLDFAEGIGAKRREAFQKGGLAGADDVSARAGTERVAEEVVGVQMAHGLADILSAAGLTHPGNIKAVSDFSARWAQRIQRGQLETNRTRGTDRNPVIGSTGVKP